MDKICVMCEEKADISYLGKYYCSKHYLEKLNEEKCVVCKKESKLGDYCVEHYVQKEDEECLYWDFYGRVRQLDPKEIEKEAQNDELLAMIIKRHPQFIDRYKKEDEKFKESIKNIE